MSRRKASDHKDSDPLLKVTLKQIKKSSPTADKTKLLSSPQDNKQPKVTDFFRIKKDPPLTIEAQEEVKIQVSEISRKPTEIIIESDSDLSYYSEGEANPTTTNPGPRRTVREMPNLMFYTNMIPSRPQGDYIDNIHKFWKNDYTKLEVHHGYVQWLFPNYYGSSFNKDAFKLTPEEAKVFRENKEVAARVVRSYEMILGFFGMVLADKKTGRIERAKNYEERYRATLITSLHNHLRVRRILAHLNVVGFRQYAIELVNFLEKEMFGEVGGYWKYISQGSNPDMEYLRSLKQHPLFCIVKHNVFRDWRLLGEVVIPEDKEKLYALLFITDEKELEPSILLRNQN